MSAVRRFESLFHEHHGFVYAAAQRLGAPVAALDNVVQDAFVTAWRHRDEMRWEVSARSWLYGITRRASAAQPNARPGAGKVQASRTPASRQLEERLDVLSSAQREAFVMTEVLGMTAPEVASELELPVEAVVARYKAAKAKLHAEWGSSDGLAGLVDAVRRQESPPARAASKHWSSLAPLLPKLAKAKTPGVPATAIVWALAAGLLVAIGFVAFSPDDEIAAEEDETPVAASPARKSEDPVPPPTPASVAPPAAAPGTAAPPAAAPPVDPAVAERAMLDQARAALASDRASAALRLSETHAEQFPATGLLIERELLRAEALCRLGRRAEGEKARDDARAQAPDATQTTPACDAPPAGE